MEITAKELAARISQAIPQPSRKLPGSPPARHLQRHVRAVAEKALAYARHENEAGVDVTQPPRVRFAHRVGDDGYFMTVLFGKKGFSSAYRTRGELCEPAKRKAAVYRNGLKRPVAELPSEVPAANGTEPAPAPVLVAVASAPRVCYRFELVVAPGDDEAVALFALLMKQEGQAVRLVGVEAR